MKAEKFALKLPFAEVAEAAWFAVLGVPRAHHCVHGHRNELGAGGTPGQGLHILLFWPGNICEGTFIPPNIYWSLSRCKHPPVDAVRDKPTRVNPVQTKRNTD